MSRIYSTLGRLRIQIGQDLILIAGRRWSDFCKIKGKSMSKCRYSVFMGWLMRENKVKR